VALDREVVDPHSSAFDERFVARQAERKDVDLASGGDERLGLAPDASILLEIGVDDDGNGSSRRRQGCHARNARRSAEPA
jgi:hypothetical protein